MIAIIMTQIRRRTARAENQTKKQQKNNIIINRSSGSD